VTGCEVGGARRTLLAALLVLLIAPLAAPAAGEDLAGGGTLAGPQGPEIGSARRQLWLVPLPHERLLMHTFLLRPPGDGPFPLVVINHGSNQNAVARADFDLSAYHQLAYWFVARGYAVALPIRPGHGATGGPYFEDQGRCDDVHYRKSGLATAASIEAAVGYLMAQPFIKKTGVVIVGQSAGGWGALALASRNPAGVQAVVNLAGGRGGHVDGEAGNNCAPDRLVSAAGEFGRTARIPTLWLYAQNDSYFAPALSERMFAAFHKAGGAAEYRLLPPLGSEGHIRMTGGAAIALWGPVVERFLHSVPDGTSSIARSAAR